MSDTNWQAAGVGRIGFANPDLLIEWSRLHTKHAQQLSEHAHAAAAGAAQADGTEGCSGEGFDEMREFFHLNASIIQARSDRKARLGMAVATCWTNLTQAGVEARAAVGHNEIIERPRTE